MNARTKVLACTILSELHLIINNEELVTKIMRRGGKDPVIREKIYKKFVMINLENCVENLDVIAAEKVVTIYNPNVDEV